MKKFLLVLLVLVLSVVGGIFFLKMQKQNKYNNEDKNTIKTAQEIISFIDSYNKQNHLFPSKAVMNSKFNLGHYSEFNGMNYLNDQKANIFNFQYGLSEARSYGFGEIHYDSSFYGGKVGVYYIINDKNYLQYLK